MAGFMDRLAYEAKDIVGQAGLEVGRRVHADGYDQAANISLGILDQKIDGLMKRTTSSDGLSKEELFLLGSLHKLRKEMEKALDNFWEQGGPSSVRADQRP